MALRGYRLSATSLRPGETLTLTLYWEAAARPGRDFTVFNHVTALDGTLWGQKDAPPGGASRPTSRWRPGEAVADQHQIALKPDTPAGSYDLYTGLYELESLQRLPIQGQGDAQRRVRLARIEVLPPE